MVDRKDEIYDVLTAQEDLAKYEGGGNHKLSDILSHLEKVRKLRQVIFTDADDNESTDDSSVESIDESANESSDEPAAVTDAGGGEEAGTGRGRVGDRNLVWSGGGQEGGDLRHPLHLEDRL